MNARDAQRYTRLAGVLFVVSIFAGGFGESFVPGKLIAANDMVETAHRMAASVGLFRASFACYLIEAACDVSLMAIFYFLLRPVSRPLSLIALCFGAVGTSVFAAGETLYFAAALPAIDPDVARALGPDGGASFTYLCLRLYGYVFNIFAVLYGTPVMLRGYLIFRSGYFPRVLGGIVMVGGAGFVVKNFVAVLAPQFDSMAFVLPMFVAMISMAFWFLAKGIDEIRWDQRMVASRQQ
jgi:hypothetical protein